MIKLAIWTVISLLFTIPVAVSFGGDFSSQGSQPGELLYHLEARDGEDQVVETGKMTINLIDKSLHYRIDGPDLSGRITFATYEEGIAKALTEFLLSPMTEEQVNMLATVFLPVQFQVDTIERKAGAGWYNAHTETGFSFLKEETICGEKILRGRFVHQGQKVADAVYAGDQKDPLLISWQGEGELIYRARSDEFLK